MNINIIKYIKYKNVNTHTHILLADLFASSCSLSTCVYFFVKFRMTTSYWVCAVWVSSNSPLHCSYHQFPIPFHSTRHDYGLLSDIMQQGQQGVMLCAHLSDFISFHFLFLVPRIFVVPLMSQVYFTYKIVTVMVLSVSVDFPSDIHVAYFLTFCKTLLNVTSSAKCFLIIKGEYHH